MHTRKGSSVRGSGQVKGRLGPEYVLLVMVFGGCDRKLQLFFVYLGVSLFWPGRGMKLKCWILKLLHTATTRDWLPFNATPGLGASNRKGEEIDERGNRRSKLCCKVVQSGGAKCR